MGADGGSIPDRSDMVRTKARSKVTDKDLLREIFFLCALSKRPLTRPVVLDPLGKLYNKDALIEYFLDRSKYGDGDRICGYLKGVKDLLTLNLSPNPEYTAPTASTTNHIPSRSPFVCPLSFKELSGTVPFLALRPCGCVYSEASIRGIIPNLTKGTAVQSVKDKEEIPNEAKPVVEAKKGTVACPNCGLYFDPTLPTSILQINPPKEVQDILLENLLTARAAAKSSKKRKATTTDTTESELPTKSKTKTKAKGDKAEIREKRPTMNTDGMHKTVAQKLADQEQKRLKAQEGMSDAVRSMFKSKDGDQRGTGGAADFFGRTFTRYAA